MKPGHFLFTCSDIFAVAWMHRLATMHSVTERRPDGQIRHYGCRCPCKYECKYRYELPLC